MKPLDFVKTPKGAIAIVTETNTDDQFGIQASISYLGGGNPTGEKNAWWRGCNKNGDEDGRLEVIDNLPSLLARNLYHPFGRGKQDALKNFPIKDSES